MRKKLSEFLDQPVHLVLVSLWLAFSTLVGAQVLR